jgi:hypothetical protein
LPRRRLASRSLARYMTPNVRKLVEIRDMIVRTVARFVSKTNVITLNGMMKKYLMVVLLI